MWVCVCVTGKTVQQTGMDILQGHVLRNSSKTCIGNSMSAGLLNPSLTCVNDKVALIGYVEVYENRIHPF